MHHSHLRSRHSTGGWVASCGAFVVLAAAPVAAQQGFWMPTSGPGGGSVVHLVAQPDGDLYASLYRGPIYRSTNGGGLWQPLAQSATRLAALPNGDLYAFGTGGVFRSRDDGVTWVHLDAAPADGRTVAAMPSGLLLLGAPSGVWRSPTDGATWEPTSLQSAISSDFVVEGAAIYVGNGNSLLTSSNDGQSWTTVTSISNVVISALARRAGGGWWIGTQRQSYYGGAGFLSRFVDGQEPETMPVYIENVTSILVRPHGMVFVAGAGDGFNESWGGIASSTDDGRTWGLLVYGGFTSLVSFAEDGIYAASTVSPGHLGHYPGMGVLRTSGPGTRWIPCNNGIVHATSFALTGAPGAVYAQAGNSLAVSQDHGISWPTSRGHFASDTYGLQLAAHPAGDVFSAAVPWVASSGEGGGSATTYSWVNRSRDGGTTWTPLDVQTSWRSSIRVTAAGSVLIPSYEGVARSTDRGDTWQNQSSGLQYEVSALQPGPVSRVFASAWGFTYVSEDDGVHWRQIATVGGDELAVSPLENRVFARQYGGPIVQLDEVLGEGDWSAQELPPLQSYGPMAVDEAGTVYVASDAVWFKRVADPEWQAVPGVPELWGPGMGGKQSILIDDAGFLYVGTGHHSVLRSRVPVGGASTTDSGHGLTIAAWQPGTTPFLQQTTFALELGDSAPVSLVLYDVRGRVVSRLWEENPLGAGRHVATWRPGAGVASGSYFYRLVAGRSTRTGRVTLIR